LAQYCVYSAKNVYLCSMILVFGGTTEGRRAAEVLEEAGNSYYYSTKTGEQELTLHYGVRTDGAMDGEAMRQFIREHAIRLMVDAAHPFAATLHQTIGEVASDMRIPVIRYERIYPPRDPDITWIDDYRQVPTDIHSLLATTGVQSISKLKWLEAEGVKVIYRILNRESSIRLAHEQGATDEQLCFYHTGDDPIGDSPHVIRYASHTGDSPQSSPQGADAILLKESGLSGGFVEKVAEAREKGMRIIALKRPELSFANTVNGPYGLRRAVEKLLPEFYPLHSGLTTGTCATAASIAATRRLLYGETPAEVAVLLPNGETIPVTVGYGDGYAYCVKEAGDDPDVTNGIEVRAKVEKATQFEICGGNGVGRFTLPGFDYPVGEAAINKGPREMIRKNILAVMNHGDSPHDSLRITISVPNGEEIAKRTFNPRLGIEGGISIIGVSGIVKPFSEEAFIDSIRKCMEVAKASGSLTDGQSVALQSERVVINSGGKSERFVKTMYPDLPQQAFVEYGNYIGDTLKIANELGIKNITLGVMLGKAVKLAAGNLDTHSRKTTMDKAFVQQMLQEAGISIDISDMKLARELWERIPECGRIPFAHVVIHHCYEHCAPLLPNGELTILLIDDNGKIYEV
jgi:cobalt-precorrin-5B (C1)-methyltransferase